MQLIDCNNGVHYFENNREVRLSFLKGIDPQIMIDKLDQREQAVPLTTNPKRHL